MSKYTSESAGPARAKPGQQTPVTGSAFVGGTPPPAPPTGPSSVFVGSPASSGGGGPRGPQSVFVGSGATPQPAGGPQSVFVGGATPSAPPAGGSASMFVGEGAPAASPPTEGAASIFAGLAKTGGTSVFIPGAAAQLSVASGTSHYIPGRQEKAKVEVKQGHFGLPEGMSHHVPFEEWYVGKLDKESKKSDWSMHHAPYNNLLKDDTAATKARYQETALDNANNEEKKKYRKALNDSWVAKLTSGRAKSTEEYEEKLKKMEEKEIERKKL